MNIKQKLTCAFAAIACLPILVVTAIVVYKERTQAEADFLDGSSREIRQVDNAMRLFFNGISENVDYLASLPQITAAPMLKNYSSADAANSPLPETNQEM